MKGMSSKEIREDTKILLMITVLHNQLLRMGLLTSNEREPLLKMNNGRVSQKMQLPVFKVML